MREVGSDGRLDFFISHAGTDEDWATWIAQQLENAGYTVELDVWNWSAGIDVIQATQQALDRACRVLAVWTPEYFTRRWADMEHRVSFAVAQMQPGWLLPVMVHACDDDAIPRLYRTLLRVELVGLTETQARQRLLTAVVGPARPTTKLPYPGVAEHGSYPGRLPPIWNVPTRNPFFTGRESLLQRLHELLAPGSATVALHGEGGMGKSGLVVEYAWRHAPTTGWSGGSTPVTTPPRRRASSSSRFSWMCQPWAGWPRPSRHCSPSWTAGPTGCWLWTTPPTPSGWPNWFRGTPAG